MNATSVDTFKEGYSPTQTYMAGLQGAWYTSDYYNRGDAMYWRILEEKIHECLKLILDK